MFHPEQDRIDYGSELRPPAGYTFDRAIATTYTLDMETILMIPVALFFSLQEAKPTLRSRGSCEKSIGTSVKCLYQDLTF